MRTLHTSPARGPDSTAAPDGATEQRGCCAKDAFRIAFGFVWLIDAGFKWQSGFAHGFRDMINSAGQGQPSWLHWFYTFTHNVFTPHPFAWAYAIAALETLIGIALILGFARKVTYIAVVITSLGIWSVAEGFGGPYNSGSTDIGAAVMYAVVALGLLALNYEAGPSRFSVDYLLEQRISWWHHVAEVKGRRRAAVPTADAPATEPEPAIPHASVIT
jgi:nitrite reductase (NO-forming)